MIIKDAEIRNFGKLRDCRFSFSNGMNVIYGPNETGKSTLQVFLKSMLFGLEKTRARTSLDEYRKYEPWEGASEFSGSLHFETGGRLFYLERNFYQKQHRDILRNEQDGEELSVAQGDLAMLLGNVSKTVYENTFCIGQDAVAADASAAREIAGRLHAPDTLRADGLRLSDAQTCFETEKKKLKKQLREAETQRDCLRKIQEEKREFLRDDIMSVRRQMAEKEEELERLSKMMEDCRKSSTGSISGTAEEEGRIPISEDTGLYRRSAENERLRESRQPESNSGRSGQYRGRSRQEDFQEEGSQPHRKKWNMLMTGGVLVFLIFGLLGRAGSIPHPAARIVCILGAVLVVAGAVQETRRQREKQDRETGRDNRKPAANGAETGRDNRNPAANGTDSDMGTRFRELQEKYTRTQTACEILKEQEQEKVTEFYNLQEEQQKISEPGEKLQNLEKELSALSLAQEKLLDLSQRRSSSRIRVMEGETAAILSEITGMPPEEIHLDPQLEPAVYEAGENRSPQARSRGSADQIYFAWRMAAGKYAASEEPLPFLMDEPFAYYDEERLEKVLQWLVRQREQIFLFTCTKREIQCLDRMEAVYRKVEMS